MLTLLIKNVRILQISDTTITTLEAQDILVKNNRIDAIQATGVDDSHFEHIIHHDFHVTSSFHLASADIIQF